jgi:uncharacterized LabA/DUF88 family protein
MDNLPMNEEQWASEAIEALKMAVKLLEEDIGGPLDETNREDLHKYAPILAAYKREIQDKSQVMEMVQYVIEQQRVQDLDSEGGPNSGELRFIAAYLDANVAIDVLDAADAERIVQLTMDA